MSGENWVLLAGTLTTGTYKTTAASRKAAKEQQP